MNKLTMLAAAALLALPGLTAAQDAVEETAEGTSHPMPRGEDMPGATHKSPEAKPAPAPVDPEAEKTPYPSWETQGWLDQSVTFDQGASSGPGVDPNAFYGLFEAAIRVSHAINENFGGHLQINGRWDQNMTVTAGVAGAFAVVPREAYAYWQNDSESVRLQFGKWYVPIGFELADPPDLYQYSNSNQFGYFLPTEAVGAIGYFTFTDNLDLAFYVSGGNFADDDFIYANGFNSLPTIGERLGISFGDAGLGLSLLVSDSGADEYDTILADVDFSTTFDALLIGAEFSLLHSTVGPGATDYGIMAMANYGVTDHLSLTGRVDFLNGDNFANPEVGITGAALVNFADGWDVVVELREDINDGGGSDANLTGALELIYQFL